MHSILYKDLVLIGGGHSHALLLKMWAMQPLAGVRLTLISPQVLTPYSGMLPGLVSGHYTLEQTHIDLARLCQYAGVRFIQSTVTRINTEHQLVYCQDRSAIGYDLLSINSGITPDLAIPGAREHVTPVKPIADFYPRWQSLLAKLIREPRQTPYHIVVVGGGAAGVELILAMHHALSQHTPQSRLQLHLIQQGQGIPEGYPQALQDHMAIILAQKGIMVHDCCTVTEVTADKIHCLNKLSIQYDSVFWCTSATAAQWPRQSGLATDEQGFISVNPCLQSTSHNTIFAAGDIASLPDPRPKAGVYAVRQAPILFHNLRAKLLGKTLKPYQAQTRFLSLLACGDQFALGCKKGRQWPTFAGHWVWHWKDHIDRKFMRKFSDLPPMTGIAPVAQPVAQAISGEASTPALMRCGGCGAKVGANTLSRVLSQLNPVSRAGVVLGIHAGEDASAIVLPEKQLLVQSVDSFRSLLGDPYLMGKIAALHALSDIFAMHAKPHSALAIATLPFASELLVERDLRQLLDGAIEVLNQHQCTLIGGHSSEGQELSIGLLINAFAKTEQLLQKSQLQPDTDLILSKPLGTGTLFAAHAQWQAQGVWIENAIEMMLQSNQAASDIVYAHQAHACTDVTGFGLLGHLLEMLKPNPLQAHLNLSAIPALPGALDCFARSISSTLQPQNLRARHAIEQAEQWFKHVRFPLLFDPQTSGGLLVCLPRAQTSACLAELKQAGYQQACVIGRVEATDSHNPYSVVLHD